jgi:aryl-alcohol dehydrogenase-like predicted oxidoreductase
VTIVGAREPKHLNGTVRAAQVRLTNEDLAEIDQILADAVPVRGPSPEGM